MHKEECQGHLRKMGIAHLEKTRGFHQERNLSQMVQYSNLALTKLMKLHPRTLEVIEFIDEAMLIKFNALNFMAQDKEALECAQERYSLWAAGNMRHYGMLNAALQLIEALLQNQDYEQSVLIASSAYEMITSRHDNIIPDGLQQQFLAEGSGYLAQATYQFARSGGIPPEETKKAGQEAIALARKALEIHTQMHGAESEQAAVDMNILADILEHFNGVGEDEALRLYEQSIATFSRVQGSLSSNVAVGEHNLGVAYDRRANEARIANDLDRYVANLELALPHYREAARVYTTIHGVDDADRVNQLVAELEGNLRMTRILNGR